MRRRIFAGAPPWLSKEEIEWVLIKEAAMAETLKKFPATDNVKDSHVRRLIRRELKRKKKIGAFCPSML